MLPKPASSTELYLEAILVELRALNDHLEGTSPRRTSGAGGDVPITGMPERIGGPWYRLPSGEKVKGKAEAQRRMTEGD